MIARLAVLQALRQSVRARLCVALSCRAQHSRRNVMAVLQFGVLLADGHAGEFRFELEFIKALRYVRAATARPVLCGWAGTYVLCAA